MPQLTTPPPPQQPPGGYPHATPPPKPNRTALWVVGVIFGLFILGSALHSNDNSSSSTTTSGGSTSFQQAQQASSVDAPAVDAPAPPAGPVTSFGAGTYAVGTDIVPGMYSSSGPDGSNFAGCYWARLKDTSGNAEAIIANNIDQGQTVVTVSASDGAFKTQGCSTWHKR